MLEHAVWLDLVEGCLKKALLLEFIVIIIIVNATELLGLLVQELEISRALILNLLFVALVVPVDFLLPLLVFLVVLVVVSKVEVVFPLGFFAVCFDISNAQIERQDF